MYSKLHEVIFSFALNDAPTSNTKDVVVEGFTPPLTSNYQSELNYCQVCMNSFVRIGGEFDMFIPCDERKITWVFQSHCCTYQLLCKVLQSCYYVNYFLCKWARCFNHVVLLTNAFAMVRDCYMGLLCCL